MDTPMIMDGTRLPTQALLVSMALASAVAAADGSANAPGAPPDVPSRRRPGSLLRVNAGVFHRLEL
jgi:hypothetical protein